MTHNEIERHLSHIEFACMAAALAVAKEGEAKRLAPKVGALRHAEILEYVALESLRLLPDEVTRRILIRALTEAARERPGE